MCRKSRLKAGLILYRVKDKPDPLVPEANATRRNTYTASSLRRGHSVLNCWQGPNAHEQRKRPLGHRPAREHLRCQ